MAQYFLKFKEKKVPISEGTFWTIGIVAIVFLIAWAILGSIAVGFYLGIHGMLAFLLLTFLMIEVTVGNRQYTLLPKWGKSVVSISVAIAIVSYLLK